MSFVCMVGMSIVHHDYLTQLSFSVISSTITATTCTCLSCSISSPSSNKYQAVRPHLSDTNRRRGKGGPLRPRMKELPGLSDAETLNTRDARFQWHIVLPTCCYLAHACPTMFYIHLVILLINRCASVIQSSRSLTWRRRMCLYSSKTVSFP